MALILCLPFLNFLVNDSRKFASIASRSLAINPHYTHLSIPDGWTGCDPNRKQSKFERNGLIITVD